jgi:formylglycine-generating enzyme required for sulfatase activity
MRRALLLPLLVAHLGCAAIAGVDDYVAVDCVGETCTELDGAIEDTIVDRDSSAGDSSTDDAANDTDTVDSTMDSSPTDSGTVDSSAKDSTAVDSSTVDSAKDVAVDTGPVTCVSTPTAVVSLGTWSIDETEVTNAQYAAFLAAKAGSTSGQPAYCAWNTSFAPASGWPAAAAKCDFPVVQVDWCDARAYCAWAGKRLCGNPTGGPTAFDGSNPISATTSQWYAACSVGGIGKYPYGDLWMSGICVDNAYDPSPADATTRVGTAAACHGVAGAYASILDMVGNVREWEDDCDGTKDGGDNCRVRGGAFNDPSDKATCLAANAVHRDTKADNIGFRCCSP